MGCVVAALFELPVLWRGNKKSEMQPSRDELSLCCCHTHVTMLDCYGNTLQSKLITQSRKSLIIFNPETICNQLKLMWKSDNQKQLKLFSQNNVCYLLAVILKFIVAFSNNNAYMKIKVKVKGKSDLFSFLVTFNTVSPTYI